MHLRKPLLLITFGIFLLIFLAQAGCSSKEEPTKDPLHEKVQKMIREEEQKRRERSKLDGTLKEDGTLKDEGVRNRLMAVTGACTKKYTSCLEKCEDDACEDWCMKKLQMCEKISLMT